MPKTDVYHLTFKKVLRLQGIPFSHMASNISSTDFVWMPSAVSVDLKTLNHHNNLKIWSFDLIYYFNNVYNGQICWCNDHSYKSSKLCFFSLMLYTYFNIKQLSVPSASISSEISSAVLAGLHCAAYDWYVEEKSNTSNNGLNAILEKNNHTAVSIKEYNSSD